MLPVGLRIALLAVGPLALVKLGGDLLIYRNAPTNPASTAQRREFWRTYLSDARVSLKVFLALFAIGVADTILWMILNY